MRHEEEMFFLSWQPDGVWDTCHDMKGFTPPFLISSVATVKQPSIRVWDRNGRDVKMLHPWEKDMRGAKLSKSFIPICWSRNPNTGKLALISCGRQGEIICYSDTMKDVIHSLHSNYTIFGLIQCGDILWSLSYEPYIVGWNLRTEQPHAILPGFRGVCTLQPSPMEGSRVALGGGDNMIRIIKMGSPNYPDLLPVEVDPPIVSTRVSGRITAVNIYTIHNYRFIYLFDATVPKL